MPPPLHLFHPGRVCIAREGDGWVGDLEREQNRSKVESDLGEGKWRRQFRVSFGTWNWRESERREIIRPRDAGGEEMLANEMQVRLQVPIGISHRLSLLSAAARKVVSIPQSRIAGPIFDLTHPSRALPRPPNFCHILPRFSFCRRNSERR